MNRLEHCSSESQFGFGSDRRKQLMHHAAMVRKLMRQQLSNL